MKTITIAFGSSEGTLKIIEALGFNPMEIRRIVIDIQYDDFVKIYVEKLIEDEALQVAADIVAGINVNVVDESE